MMNKVNDVRPHPGITTYITQHFNPKKLPALLLCLLPQQSTLLGQGNSLPRDSKTVLELLHSPQISMLLANMKMYDTHTMARENTIIDAMMKCQSNFGNGPKLNKFKKVNTHSQRNLSNSSAIQEKEQIKTKKSFKQELEFLFLCQKSYFILSYRLQDLNFFIIALSENQHPFKKVIWQLEEICEMLINQIEKIKASIENILDQFFRLTEDCRGGSELYDIRKYAKQCQQRTKQINLKYTQVSRAILKRQAEHKKEIERRKEIQLHFQNNEFKQNIYPQTQDKVESQNVISSFNSSKYSNNGGISHRSILKNKYGSNKPKRISIQIITSMLESERRKFEAKSSRFGHRPAVKISSAQKIAAEKETKQRAAKRMKKQVKIDHFQTLEEQLQEEENQNGGSGTRPRRTNLQLFDAFCERAEREGQDDNSSSQSYSRVRRYFSWQEIRSENKSMQSITSKGSKKSKGKSKKNLKTYQRRGTRKFTQKLGKSYNSCKQIKRIKSSKNIKDKQQLSQSLKNIFMEALENKKKKFDAKSARSGRIVPQMQGSTEDVEQINIVPRRNYKLYNRKAHQNRYKHLIQDYHKGNDNSKEEEPKLKTARNAPARSARRVGVVNEDTIKQIQQENMSSKNKSQTISISSSKKYQFSSTRINIIRPQVDTLGLSRNRKVKTQQSSQDMVIPAHFAVKYEQKFNFADSFVKFYPSIECSLYQITKRHEKQQFLFNSMQNYNQSKIPQFVPMSNFTVRKHVHQQSLEVQIKQREQKKKMFLEEDLKIKFGKKLIGMANELEQKELQSTRG